MVITVKDIIDSTLLGKTNLIGGGDGVNKIVETISVISIPSDNIIHYQNELLLVTVNSHIEPSYLEDLLKQIDKSKCSGIVIKTNKYLDKISLQLINLADKLKLPFFITNNQIIFSQLSSTITTFITEPELLLLKQELEIINICRSLVLSGDGFNKLIENLSSWTGCHISVHNSDGEIIASSKDFPLQSIVCKVEEILKLNPVCNKQNYAMFKLEFDKKPIYCKVKKIVNKKRTVGWCIAWSEEEKTDIKEFIALRETVVQLGFILIKEQEINQREAGYITSFATSLLYENFEPEPVIMSKCKIFSCDFYGYCSVVIIESTSISEPRFVRRLKREITSIEINTGCRILTTKKSQSKIVLIICFPSKILSEYLPEKIKIILESLRDFLVVNTGKDWVIAIGKSYKKVSNAHIAYNEADEALQIGIAVWGWNRILNYANLGAYKLFKNFVTNINESEKILDEYIGPLLNYDTQNTELMNTIDIYLKNDCSINDTAEKLFIHPNTLQYRLNKVKSLCGLDYKKTEDKFILLICSLIYNMNERQKKPPTEF